MATSKITTNGFNFANTLSRGDFTDSSFGDIVLLENEVGGLLMDSSASGVDVDGHILYNNNESAFFFRDISSTQLSDGAVTLSKISSDTKDQLNEDHIALENEDGNLLLNSSAASTDEGDRVVYDSPFNPSIVNDLGGGILLQQITTAVAKATFTSAIPDDDTTPTISEGTEIYSQAITPSATSSKIFITGSIEGSSSQANGWGIAVFRGSTCILTVHDSNAEGGGQPDQCNINVLDSPSTTAETTYSIRAGSMAGSSAIYIQRRSSEKYNGTMALNSVTLQEIKGS